MTWPPPELDVGVDDGELRPELPEPELAEPEPELAEPEPELAEPEPELAEPEPELAEPEPELPVLELAWCVLVADDPVEVREAADAAPGRLTATAPAAARLAAAAERVATRSRLRPRSRSSTLGIAPRDGMLCLLMLASLAVRFPMPL